MTPEMAGDILIYSLPILSMGVTFGLTAGGIYLNRKYQHNKLVQALVVLDQIVIDVVKELNQTVVEELKAARADGKLTRDEAEQIKSKAIDLILKRAGISIMNVIQRSFGQGIHLISTKIEAAVFDHKKYFKKSSQLKKMSQLALA